MHWIRAERLGAVGDLVETDAMDPSAFKAAWEAGVAAVDALDSQTKIVIFGEMGIGNTTPASALSARLMNKSAAELVGPGTGVEGDVLKAKRALVQRST